jgi:hypothetical protein
LVWIKLKPKCKSYKRNKKAKKEKEEKKKKNEKGPGEPLQPSPGLGPRPISQHPEPVHLSLSHAH